MYKRIGSIDFPLLLYREHDDICKATKSFFNLFQVYIEKCVMQFFFS